jgi:hypothetical protein
MDRSPGGSDFSLPPFERFVTPASSGIDARVTLRCHSGNRATARLSGIQFCKDFLLDWIPGSALRAAPE